MKKIVDLTNSTFGKLRVLEFVGRENGETFWRCECECGNIVNTTTRNLRSKNSKSCGCMKGGVGKSKNFKFNKWTIVNGIAYGESTNTDDVFMVDFDDYEKVNKYCWRIDPHGYVVANNKIDNKILKLHKLLLNTSEMNVVDHKNQNKLDNTKENLREATKSQNNSNIKKRSDNFSGYTGVKFHKPNGKWKSQISYNCKRIHLGTFERKIDAIIARKEAEMKYHKKFDGEVIRNDFKESTLEN